MNFEWIGWCREGSHDKIWAVYVLESRNEWLGWLGVPVVKYATIWGRRGKELQSKVFDSSSTSHVTRISEKLRKGYTQISTDKLKEVYPEFQEDLEKAAFWATLKG